MSTHAQVTEAHLRLANQLVSSPPSPLVLATLIADSEARACDQLRAEVEQLKEYSANLENDVKYLTQGVPEGDPLFLAVARAERAEAELATAKAIIASIEEDGTEEHNAAVRLRQELATERARLDYVMRVCHATNREAIDAAVKEGSA